MAPPPASSGSPYDQPLVWQREQKCVEQRGAVVRPSLLSAAFSRGPRPRPLSWIDLR